MGRIFFFIRNFFPQKCKPIHGLYWLCILFIVVVVGSCKENESEAHEKFKAIAKNIQDSFYLRYGFSKSVRDADLVQLETVFANIKKPTPAEIGWHFYYKAHNRLDENNEDAALLYADSCIHFLQGHAGSNELALILAKTLFLKGLVVFHKRDYDEAMRCVVLGKLALPEEISDNNTLYDYYDNMGNILYEQKRFLQAIKFYRLKCLLAPKLNRMKVWEIGFVQGNLNNIAISYKKINMLDSANYYFDSTLRYLNRDTQRMPVRVQQFLPVMKAVVYSNKADLIYQLKDTAEAERLYLQCASNVKKGDDNLFKLSNWIDLTNIYLDDKKIDKAGWALEQIILEEDTVSMPHDVREYTHLRYTYYRYYTAINQLATANNMLQQALQVKDSLAKKRFSFLATDISLDIAKREQKAIIEKQQQENQLKTNSLLVITIAVVLAIAVMVMIAYNLKRKSQHANKLAEMHRELTLQNQELEKTLISLYQSNKENDRLVRVVAHDLKSPISAMRTLVYVLKKDPLQPDKEVLELIERTCADAIVRIKGLLGGNRA